MVDRKRWRIYALTLALVGLIAMASVPSAWAAPLALPSRQTVPSPTVPAPTSVPATATPVPAPPSTPVPIPVLSISVHVPIRNEGTVPMTGCSVVIDEVSGIEYLVEGQLQTPPYTYPLETLAPGAETAFDFVAQLAPNALPCASYPIRVSLQCGGDTTVLQETVLNSPCDVLPLTGG